MNYDAPSISRTARVMLLIALSILCSTVSAQVASSDPASPWKSRAHNLSVLMTSDFTFAGISGDLFLEDRDSVYVHRKYQLQASVFPNSLAALPRSPMGEVVVGTVPVTLPVSRLEVSLLQGTFARGNSWEISATVTDPGNERLFKNLTDLFALDGSMLRQAPSRHLWLSFRRGF